MRALVALVGEPVRRYLHRRIDAATADDVYGDVLLVLWRRLDDVPADPDHALPWAIVVARQCLANAQRSERRRTRLVGRIIAIDPPAPVAGDPATSTPSADDRDTSLHEALARLRRDDAELLRLWAWEELTPTQLAVALGITPNAVSIRLHRAKARLKCELEALLDEAFGPDPDSAADLKDPGSAGHVTAKEGSTHAR
jgi:RNA polymerase sigma-70 factor, ECF subfamily